MYGGKTAQILCFGGENYRDCVYNGKTAEIVCMAGKLQKLCVWQENCKDFVYGGKTAEILFIAGKLQRFCVGGILFYDTFSTSGPGLFSKKKIGVVYYREKFYATRTKSVFSFCHRFIAVSDDMIKISIGLQH